MIAPPAKKEAIRGYRLIVTLPVAAAIILGVTFGKLPGNNLLWNELQNTGHTLLFGLLALVTLSILRVTRARIQLRPPAEYLYAGIACLAIGVAIEFAQMFSGRGFSVPDVIRDLCGAIITLGTCAVFDPEIAPVWAKLNRGSRGITLLVCCCLLIACLYPLANLAYAYEMRQRAFPTIIDFTTHWSKPFLRLQHARLEQVKPPEAWTAAPGKQSAWLTFYPARHPGINIIEPYPDWTAHKNLLFNLFSARTESFDLVLRVHDHLHDQTLSDRFNQRLSIRPGENSFRIPLNTIRSAPASRDMDMSQINGVILFAADIAEPIDFHASVLRLE